MAGLGDDQPRAGRRSSASRLSSWARSAEEQPLVDEAGAEEQVRFWPWLCGNVDSGSQAHHFVLVALFGMSLTMSIAGVILVCVKSLHSSALVLDVMVEWLDMISYFMAILCEYWCINASPEKRRRYEFRTAVVSTLLLALTGAKNAYSAAAELICSEDLTFSATQSGDKPCAFLQLRPHPNVMIAVSLTLLFAYIPVAIVARFASAKDFSPEESVNKAAVLLHVGIDVLTQLLVFVVSLGILWDPSYAVVADVAAAGVILLSLGISTSVLWYRYYVDE